MEVQEGLAIPFQQKLGFTQMLRIFRVDTSNAFISISIARQGPFFQVQSHIQISEKQPDKISETLLNYCILKKCKLESRTLPEN